MTHMFSWCNNFEGKGLEHWNISNVIKTSNMFHGCHNFNCDLSKWNVSNIYDTCKMFKECKNFEGKGLENWNLEKIVFCYDMFYECDKIAIPKWYKKYNF